ncbi:hypothetical protein HKX48_008210 [Thoreauomyces humboldtii]|nr:hypothetical protein HKX48_008210 [Thoreauomyces humboldtii]
MSSVDVPDFKSGPILEQIRQGIAAQSDAEKKQTLKKVNGVFELVIKNAAGKEQTWGLELKKEGRVALGKPEGKADITISMSDDTFADLASGKLNGQKAFMSGKLKVKGNMMLATRLDTVLKAAKPAAAPTSATAASAKPVAAPAPALTSAPAPSPAAAAAAPTVPVASAGSIEVPGFQSSAVFGQIKSGIDAASADQKAAIAKKTKAVFQFDVKSSSGQVQTWTLNLKDTVSVSAGAPTGKPDIVISIADKDFVDLASGKLNGQKAFMGGKLKIKGNMMLATKLDSVLKELKPKSKL